jgi:hypothetical protein
LLHSRVPGEVVERKLKLGAGFGHSAARFAVHMDVPCQRSERSEIVLCRPRRGFFRRCKYPTITLILMLRSSCRW